MRFGEASRPVPGDFADIVVYRDDTCKEPYLVVENKASGQRPSNRKKWIEQLFGNSDSLRAPFGLYEDSDNSVFYSIGEFPPTERTANRLGDRDSVPSQYGDAPEYVHIAGQPGDIEPVAAGVLGARIRRPHYITISRATKSHEAAESISADCRRNAPDEAGHEITTFAPCCPIRSTGKGLIANWPSV